MLSSEQLQELEVEKKKAKAVQEDAKIDSILNNMDGILKSRMQSAMKAKSHSPSFITPRRQPICEKIETKEVEVEPHRRPRRCL